MWRILCVDDHNDSCTMLAATLELANANYHVESAESAEEAMELVSNSPFDLYILDRVMPGMDGAEFCRWVRKIGSTSPIVFYSGAVREIDKTVAFDAGADEYLLKPDDLSRLEEVVAKLLADLKHGAGRRQQIIM